MGSRKRQALLSKLGTWEPWERVEGEGRGAEKNVEFKKSRYAIKSVIKKTPCKPGGNGAPF